MRGGNAEQRAEEYGGRYPPCVVRQRRVALAVSPALRLLIFAAIRAE